jgi:hypothetical protein
MEGWGGGLCAHPCGPTRMCRRGARSTHIVIAMRLGPNQDLFMVESTAKDA